MFIIFVSAWYYSQKNSSTPIMSQQSGFFSTEVTLVISVPEDMPNTNLKIIMPDNVILTGYEGTRELSLLVNLKQGGNTLSVPIEVANAHNLKEALRFVAEINYNNKQKDFELSVTL